jgi:hypothetical protein
MGWLVAVGVFGIVIYLLVVSRSFRIGVAIFVALVGAGIWLFFENQEAAERRSLSLVNQSEIELRNLRLVPNYGSYKLLGEIKNNSAFIISGIAVQVTAYDCPIGTELGNLGRCEIIGEDIAYPYPSVPPGQVRAIDQSVWFSGMPQVKGRFTWTYSLSEIRAK